jgi:hypothetical protein
MITLSFWRGNLIQARGARGKGGDRRRNGPNNVCIYE